jgi:hypothetical protein
MRTKRLIGLAAVVGAGFAAAVILLPHSPAARSREGAVTSLKRIDNLDILCKDVAYRPASRKPPARSGRESPIGCGWSAMRPTASAASSTSIG